MKWTSLLLLATATTMWTGCEAEQVGVPHAHDDAAEVVVCGMCGELKNGEKCCKEGFATCPSCGLHKDSILCCSTAIHGIRDVHFCRKCGEVGFTPQCCREGAERCEKCGLIEGSPGCCKIKPYDPNESHDADGGHE